MPVTDPDQTGALLEKTAGGAGWTIGWRAATRALGFLSTLVLARVLVPADFGLVALAMSYAQAIDVFANLGVQDALVRATNSDRAMYDAAFTVNAVRGFVTAVVIGATAGPFASFFEDPRLFYVGTGARAGGAAGCVRECRRCGLPSQFRLPPRIPVVNLPAPRTGRGDHRTRVHLGELLGTDRRNTHCTPAAELRQLCHAPLSPAAVLDGLAGHCRIFRLDLDGQHGLDGPRARHHADHRWHAESDATRCLHSRLGDCHAAGKRTHRPVEPGLFPWFRRGSTFGTRGRRSLHAHRLFHARHCLASQHRHLLHCLTVGLYRVWHEMAGSNAGHPDSCHLGCLRRR